MTAHRPARSLSVRKKSAWSFGAAVIAITCVYACEVVFDAKPLGYAMLTATYFALFALRGTRDTGGLILFIAGLIVFVFPYLGETLRGSEVTLLFYALYFWAVFLIDLLAFGAHPAVPSAVTAVALHPSRRKLLDAQTLKVAALSGLAVVGAFIWFPLHAALYAFALIHLGRQCAQSSSSGLAIYSSLTAVVISMLLYMEFVWDAFGRLNMLTFLLMPALIAHHYGRIVIKKSLVVLAAPVGFLYGSFVRGADGLDWTSFAGGSASSSLLLQDDLIRNLPVTSDVLGLVDQYLLLFLSWVPRGVWTEKPMGMGWLYVDRYIGRFGYSDEHSIALGVWGEHIYLNPNYWWLTGTLTLAGFALVYRGLQVRGGDYTVAAILFGSNVLTLLWGGMASFGARVWWLVLPCLAYIVVTQKLAQSRK